MLPLRTATRYANSLLKQAIEKGNLERVHEDMLLFKQVCNDNKLFLKTLQSPIVNHDKKLAILNQLFKTKVEDLVINFFKMISQNGREAIMYEMAQTFLQQYNNYKGIQAATLITPCRLSEDLMDRFKTLVKSIVPCQEVVLHPYIDRTLLGGYILKIGDKQLDESLISKLHALQKSCTAPGY